LDKYRYRRVSGNHGSQWIVQAFQLFKQSLAAWFGTVAFLMLMLVIPVINNITALLMPIAIGGIMIGCKQISPQTPFKFDHLFSGLKTDAKQLLILSAVYAIASLAILLATIAIMQLAGIDYLQVVTDVMPKSTEAMTQQQAIEWMASLNEGNKMMILLVGLLISLALMIPLYMAFWFAPALVVFQKATAVKALKLSYSACKDNFLSFLVYGLVAFAYMMFYFFSLSITMMIFPLLSIPLFFGGILAIFAITLITIYTAYVDIFEPSQSPDEQYNGSDKGSDPPSDGDDSSMLA